MHCVDEGEGLEVLGAPTRRRELRPRRAAVCGREQEPPRTLSTQSSGRYRLRSWGHTRDRGPGESTSHLRRPSQRRPRRPHHGRPRRWIPRPSRAWHRRRRRSRGSWTSPTPAPSMSHRRRWWRSGAAVPDRPTVLGIGEGDVEERLGRGGGRLHVRSRSICRTAGALRGRELCIREHEHDPRREDDCPKDCPIPPPSPHACERKKRRGASRHPHPIPAVRTLASRIASHLPRNG